MYIVEIVISDLNVLKNQTFTSIKKIMQPLNNIWDRLGEDIMEFSITSIQEAHKRYTGPDFPKLIKAFKSMGIITNIFNLETGIITYMNRSGEVLEDGGMKVDFEICEV